MESVSDLQKLHDEHAKMKKALEQIINMERKYYDTWCSLYLSAKEVAKQALENK